MQRDPVRLFVCVIALSSGATTTFGNCLSSEARQDEARQNEPQTQTALSGQVELARLVDLCAQRLGLKIEYDAAAVKGTVTLRLGEPVSDEELWRLTNRVLSARGLASVQSSEKLGVISIVKLADAPGLARVQESVQSPNFSGATSGEGFVNLVVRIEHQSTKNALESVKPLLSKAGGAVADLGGGYMLISDLRPRIDDVTRVLQLIDVPGVEPTVERIPPQFVSATQLAGLVTAASAARDAVTGQPQKGKVLAAPPDGTTLVLIAPPDELAHWHDLIARFDHRQDVVTQSYLPKHFGVSEVAKLLEQVARDQSPRGSGEQWRVVTDELTGALFVTATPSEHERIATLFLRLDAMPSEARRPVRVFAIHNRDVRQIAEVVSKLVEAGVLETGEVEPPSSNGTSSAVESRFNPLDQTSVNQQPPLSAATMPPPAPGTANPTDQSTGIERPLMVPPPGGSAAAGSNRVGTSAPRSSSKNGAPGPGAPPLVLTADEGTNTLIATGEPRLLSQLAELIRTLDVRQPQVMIEVLVASLSDSDSLNLGVELQKLTINGDTIIALSSLFGLGSPALTGMGSTSPPPRGRGFTGVVLDPGDFSVVVQALQTLNHGRSLSMPKVLVNNNQQATLNSVLQQPFSSTNASTTVATTSFGGTQDAGTTVTVKPHIAEADHLVLDYSVTLSAFVGEPSDPTLPPPRQSNNLTSAVTIPDGYTVVVGGLEIVSESNNVSQVPLLGSIPLVGEAFKNRVKAQSRTRFFVFIHSEVLRNGGFEDLKFLSDQDVAKAVIENEAGWPEVEPRIIK